MTTAFQGGPPERGVQPQLPARRDVGTSMMELIVGKRACEFVSKVDVRTVGNAYWNSLGKKVSAQTQEDKIFVGTFENFRRALTSSENNPNVNIPNNPEDFINQVSSFFQNTHFVSGFATIQRLAKSLPSFLEGVAPSSSDDIQIIGVQFKRQEFMGKAIDDQKGILLMRYISDELQRRCPENQEGIATQRGILFGQLLFEQAAYENTNPHLDSILESRTSQPNSSSV